LSDVNGELARVEHDHESSDVRWGLKLDEREYQKTDDAIEANTPAPQASAAGPGSITARKVVRLDEAGPATSADEESAEGSDEASPRPLLKLGPRGQIEQSDPDEGATAPTKKGKPNAGDAQAIADYEQAQKLIGAKKWQPALDAFAGFLLRYPDHAYAANAFYWRGECYYALGDFGSAALQFEGLLSRFPASAKAPDALLKLGLSERKLGSKAKAKATFERLRRDYPLAEATKKIPPEDAP
jgi:tol-pal system protein YbgF